MRPVGRMLGVPAFFSRRSWPHLFDVCGFLMFFGSMIDETILPCPMLKPSGPALPLCTEVRWVQPGSLMNVFHPNSTASDYERRNPGSSGEKTQRSEWRPLKLIMIANQQPMIVWNETYPAGKRYLWFKTPSLSLQYIHTYTYTYTYNSIIYYNSIYYNSIYNYIYDIYII